MKEIKERKSPTRNCIVNVRNKRKKSPTTNCIVNENNKRVKVTY